MFKNNLLLQSKFKYSKESINIPSSVDYIISPDGSFFATINESNNFSLFFLEDIAYGHLHCFYKNNNKCVSAIAFVQFSNSSLNKDLRVSTTENSGSNFQFFSQSFNKGASQLAIALIDEPIIEIFNISNSTFSSSIKIQNPIISMKTDRFNPAQIFYIEKGTRNLMIYNFITLRNEIISNDVNFFEELADGSLIISTQAGIKYFDKQSNLICIQDNYLKPIAYFSLSYQKVLMIGTTESYYPSFIVFDPLSKKHEPIYKLPYFEIEGKEVSENYDFCCCNDGYKSFYIGSSTSSYVVHCILEGDFYTIEKVENLYFPILAMHQIKVNNGVLAIFGQSKIALFKFLNNINNDDIYNYHIKYKKIKNQETLNQPENEELKKTFMLIKELPRPSNPLQAVSFLKSEADPILKSSDNLSKNIESVLKEQIIAFNLSYQLKNKKEWNSNDDKYYAEKIEIEKAAIRHNLQNIANRNRGQQYSNFIHRFSYAFENTPPESANIGKK